MAERWQGKERRKTSGEFRVRPRSSPASRLVLTVAAVLAATAAATVLADRGFSDATPHGRALGTLSAVADAQEAWYGGRGRFSVSPDSLGVEVPEGVELSLVRRGSAGWEAEVRIPGVGLSCVQEGEVAGGRPVRLRPLCYTDQP